MEYMKKVFGVGPEGFRAHVERMKEEFISRKDSIAKAGRWSLVTYAWRHFFSLSVIPPLPEPGFKLTPLHAEAVAAEIVRRGLPREKVRASANAVTLDLPNGRYRIYREGSGYGAGSFASIRDGFSSPLPPLSVSDTADAIMGFDEAVPLLLKVEKVFMAEAMERERAEKAIDKAREIRFRSVEAILESALAPLGIKSKYRVMDDGTVLLSMRKEFMVGMEVKVEELADMFSDPEKVKGLFGNGSTGWNVADPCFEPQWTSDDSMDDIIV